MNQIFEFVLSGVLGIVSAKITVYNTVTISVTLLLFISTITYTSPYILGFEINIEKIKKYNKN